MWIDGEKPFLLQSEEEGIIDSYRFQSLIESLSISGCSFDVFSRAWPKVNHIFVSFGYCCTADLLSAHQNVTSLFRARQALIVLLNVILKNHCRYFFRLTWYQTKAALKGYSRVHNCLWRHYWFSDLSCTEARKDVRLCFVLGSEAFVKTHHHYFRRQILFF